MTCKFFLWISTVAEYWPDIEVWYISLLAQVAYFEFPGWTSTYHF